MRQIMRYFLLLLAISDAQFTKTVIRGPKRRITKKTLFKITYNGESNFIPLESDERAVRQPEPFVPIPEEPKYKNWGSPPKHMERGIMNSIVQWSEISNSGSGKIGNGFNILTLTLTFSSMTL